MKNIRFLIFISTLTAVTFVVLIIFNSDSNQNQTKDFAFGDILEEINLASNESFTEISQNQITTYLPLTFSTYDNLLFAIDVNNEKEYFLIATNLNYNDKAQIESLYLNIPKDQSFIFYSKDKYVYVVKSEKYSYMIEGIMKSFITNYENKK